MDSLNRHLTKEDVHVRNKHMKRCSPSCVIREMQTKAKMRYACAPVRKSKLLRPPHTGKGQQARSFTVGRIADWHSRCGRWFRSIPQD